MCQICIGIPIFYINLEKDRNRRNYITKLLSLAFPKNKITRIPGIVHSIGLEGCRLAHIKANTVALETKKPFYIILEDDIESLVPLDNIIKYIHNIIYTIKFDLVLLEQGTNLETSINMIQENKNLYRVFGGGNNAGAYLCTHEFGKKLVQLWKKNPLWHCHHSWQTIWPFHNVFFHKPVIFNQRAGKSNQSEVDPRKRNVPFQFQLWDKYKKRPIPKIIFQTFKTNQLPKLMKKSVDLLRSQNKDYQYVFHDDNMMKKFIYDNFPISVYESFIRLKPGAYRADLWRYCILYIFGGIYLDIKYQPVNGFRFDHLLSDEEYFVKDLDVKGVYTAFIICRPRNEILLRAIYQICRNVKNKYYGCCFLCPTGPHLLGRYFYHDQKKTFVLTHEYTGKNINDKYINFNGKPILKCYQGYYEELVKNNNIHYTELYENKDIYKD